MHMLAHAWLPTSTPQQASGQHSAAQALIRCMNGRLTVKTAPFTEAVDDFASAGPSGAHFVDKQSASSAANWHVYSSRHKSRSVLEAGKIAG